MYINEQLLKNNGSAQIGELFAEVAGLEPCLGGAGPYEVHIVTDWHRAKGVVRRWKSEATLTFRRLFTSMSNRLHLGPPPRPRLKMQGG